MANFIVLLEMIETNGCMRCKIPYDDDKDNSIITNITVVFAILMCDNKKLQMTHRK